MFPPATIMQHVVIIYVWLALIHLDN